MAVESLRKLILSPTEEIIDLTNASGDTESGIRFELTGEEEYLDKLPIGKVVKKALKNGQRVFVTEDDELLFVQPK